MFRIYFIIIACYNMTNKIEFFYKRKIYVALFIIFEYYIFYAIFNYRSKTEHYDRFFFEIISVSRQYF